MTVGRGVRLVWVATCIGTGVDPCPQNWTAVGSYDDVSPAADRHQAPGHNVMLQGTPADDDTPR